MADLYAHLLAGRSLGQAATAARQALAADPQRQVGAVPVSLQDWAVPVVYESAPLVLLRPPQRPAPLIRLASAETGPDGSGAGPGGVPRPPDAGFFGRDETLLALDRAFDDHPVVLLHAFAGAGKSSTAAEFARWYAATGGLDHPEHPEWGPGLALWSSFERHLTADRLLGLAGDRFAGLFEANDIAWAAVTDPDQRRDLVLQALAQMPVLWVWDNVEPVAGFPAGAVSTWTPDEQGDLAGLLRELAERTRCKVLLTSRRDERGWLGDLPERVRLPAMPMRESLQLATELADRHGRGHAGADWRPLLRYAAGNPLTITVVIGQALRENLTSTADIEGFLTRLQAGEAQLEAAGDAALGRTRSLAASLDYGFATAFTGAERSQLAVLHLFRDTVDVDALRLMGDPGTVEDAVPELARLGRDTGIALLDRAAEIGLLSSLGGGYYQIHPALPWYFASFFTVSYGQVGEPPADRAARAYVRTIGYLGDQYYDADVGHPAQVIAILRAEEANLLGALDLARAWGLWTAVIGCMQGLSILYKRTGRDSEWARLVSAVTPDFTDRTTGHPLPGREGLWNIVTGYRVELARSARDWSTAIALLDLRIGWNRARAAEALDAPVSSLTAIQLGRVRNLASAVGDLGNILLLQKDPGCLPHFQEALALVHRIGNRPEEAQHAGSLGNAYMLPGLRDLEQAEHWFKHSLSLRPDSDRLGRAMNLGSLGHLALERFDDARDADEVGPVLLKYLSGALSSYQQALDLFSADDHQNRGITENQLGLIHSRVGDTRQALRHFQQSIRHKEVRGAVYEAGYTRFNIAVLLFNDGRVSDALPYARAALDNFRQAGVGAAAEAANTEQFIANLEQRAAGP
jgi:tetratricopeptide (TPR) repeat protein